MMQFSLISLIPGLLRNLQDCAGPELNNYEKKLTKPTSLRTSDRNSLLSYMGLPLQIFGKVSFNPAYTSLWTFTEEKRATLMLPPFFFMATGVK